jgi:hypothetical protein
MTESKRSVWALAIANTVLALSASVPAYGFGEQNAREECRERETKAEARQKELAEMLKPPTPEERAREEYAFEIRYNAEKMRLTEPRRRRECEAAVKRIPSHIEVSFRKTDDGSSQCMRRSACDTNDARCEEWMRWTP